MTSADLSDFAYNVGFYEPDRAWLLHDFDVWLKNPHYRGEPVPHPEDDSEAYGPPVPWLTLPVSKLDCTEADDDIPW